MAFQGGCAGVADRQLNSAMEQAIHLYRTMKLIREVETSLAKLFADGEVPGFIHLSVGQEAVAAGVCAALGADDSVATTHRGHGHVLARGLDLGEFFLEIMGKAEGICAGRGGSMHVSDMRLGIIGANGIVGAGIPIALGSALSHSIKKNGAVAVAFFGDGAMAEGVLHESMNIASLWKLPLLLVCENNGWSEFSPTSRQFAAKLESLGGAFGIEHCKVDGNNALDVHEAASLAVASMRSSPRASILECITHRVHGHYEGDPQKYRDPEDLATLVEHDPLNVIKSKLAAMGFDEKKIATIDDEVAALIAHAIKQAQAGDEPNFEQAVNDVYSPSTPEAA